MDEAELVTAADQACEILEAGGKMLAHPDTALELIQRGAVKDLVEAYGPIIRTTYVPRGKLVFALPQDEE